MHLINEQKIRIIHGKSTGPCNKTSADADARGDEANVATQTQRPKFRSRKNLMPLFEPDAGDRPDSGVSSDEEREPSMERARIDLFGPNECILCDSPAIMDKDEM